VSTPETLPQSGGERLNDEHFIEGLTPASVEDLQQQADAEAFLTLQGLQRAEGASRTFAAVNGFFQSDEIRPGADVSPNLMVSKTTLTENQGKDDE
jgi:hypothetical protein